MRVRTLVLLGALVAAPLAAQERQALVITVQNLSADNEAHQALVERGGDANALLPGDVVLYRLVFTNIQAERVQQVKFVDPIPAGLRYIDSSAVVDREDVDIEYSIDGGQTFSATPMIEEVIDGEARQVPAPPERFTHVRWTVQGWVQPGAQVTAEFQAMLPGPSQGG